jgi:hypothetical protein
VLWIRGKSSSVTEMWNDAYELYVVLSLVQTTRDSFSCYFREFSTSLAETSGEKRETNRAFVLGLFGTTGREEEFRTPYIGVLSFPPVLLLSLIFTTRTPPRFFLVTVVKPSSVGSQMMQLIQQSHF